MPKTINPECEPLVKAFSKDGLSIRAIKKKLQLSGFSISKSTVANIINNVGVFRQSSLLGQNTPSKSYPFRLRTPELVKKVCQLTNKENPESQRNIAKLCGVSQTTINKVIKVDPKKVTRRKTKLHVLKPRHIKNRKTTSRKLYEKNVAGQRFKKCGHIG